MSAFHTDLAVRNGDFEFLPESGNTIGGDGRKVLPSLALGATTTILVVWSGLALWIDPHGQQLGWSYRSGTGDCWSYWLYARPGAMLIQRASSRHVMVGDLMTGDGQLTSDDVPSWTRRANTTNTR